jgi:ATP-binding cassette subfamily C protein CydC
MVWHLLVIIAPAWPVMLAAMLLALATIGANVGLMAASAYLISAAALHPPLATLSVAIVGVRFFGIARAGFRYLERYLSHDATFRLLSRIRVWLYIKLEPLVPDGLAHHRRGEVWNSIVHDVEILQFFYLRVLLPPGVAIACALGMCLWLEPFGGGFVLLEVVGFAAVGCLLPLGLYFQGKWVGAKLAETRSRLTMLLAENMWGMREILAFGQEKSRQLQVVDASRQYGSLQSRRAHLGGLADAGANLAQNLVLVCSLAIGIMAVTGGRLPGVYLAVVALGMQSSFEAVLPMATAYLYWEESLAAAKRLFVILDAKAPLVSDQQDDYVAGFGLQIKNLSFGYRKGLPLVLNNISLSVPAGGRVAVVGPSGAGKSTLAALLLKLWNYEEGHIILGGQELARYSPEAVREVMGFVPQQAYVFHATLADNLQLAKPQATGDEIKRVAERASLGSLIAGLPQGMDSLVGADGQGLSGGERQRVAIARALLKDPKVLILDEPIAGLDQATAQEIMAAVAELMEGRTTILITHQLLGLESMDEIIVLDKGQVVEQGKYEDLLARQGLFYELWSLQQDMITR